MDTDRQFHYKNELSRRQFLKTVGKVATGIGLGGILSTGCSPGILSQRGNKLNAILIVDDTLRADHLGCYGYHRNTSPSIDKFASNNIFFENAFTVSPKTYTSMPALFTGLYPMNSGMIDTRQWMQNDELESFVEVLPKNYERFAVVSNPWLTRNRGYKWFSMGNFQCIPEYVQGEVSEVGLEWLKKRDSKKPFFLWLHYFNPHGPYTPVGAFNEMFVEDSFYDPTKKLHFEYLGDDLKAFLKLDEGKTPLIGYVPYINGKDNPDYYIAQYDAEIRQTDTEIGKIFNFLKESGLTDNTMIVFTSDHGESLGENNCFCDHGNLVDNANIRIPLLISHPDIKSPQRINSLIENVDISPTILSELGLKFSNKVDGMNFSYVYHDKTPDAKFREFFHSSTPQVYAGHYRTVGTLTRKLIVRDKMVLLNEPDFSRKFADIEALHHSYDLPDANRFYDISERKLDINENRITPTEEELLKEIKKIGKFWGFADSVVPPMSEEEKRRLKGLGYL